MKRLMVAVGLALSTWVTTRGAPAPSVSPVRFTDVTADAGITFRHFKGGTGRHYYPEQFGAGAALLDFDNDGFLDLFFVQGGTLPGFQTPSPPRNALYRNNGNGTFVDVTRQAGVSQTGYGLGVAVADYDNDGFADLFITTLGGNVLLRNDGHGRFLDVTTTAGVKAPGLSTGAAFLDVDNDGWLDLFVARYTDYLVQDDLRCIDAASVAEPVLFAQPRSAPVPPDATLKLAYCGPPAYKGTASRLYRNNGNGTFSDVTQRSGIGKGVSHGLGVAVADFNEDGRPDIFVASDMMPNLLFMNSGSGIFVEQALTAGVALSSLGKPLAGMGVDAADYDNDGHLDLFVTNYEGEPSSLYKGHGDGTFDDKSVAAGIAGFSQRYLKWGTRFVDLDIDGLLDLLVLNGHVDDNLGDGSPPRLPSWPAPTRPGGGVVGTRLMLPGREGYMQRAQVYRGVPQGRFEDVSLDAGPYFTEKHAGRGAAFGDIDNDGDWDVVVVNNDERAVLLRNDSAPVQGWGRLELHGHGCNRDAIGARVVSTSASGSSTQYVPTAGSYLSESDRRLLIPIPLQASAVNAQIRWPCGATETVQVKAGATTKVEEANCRLAARPAGTLPK